jgi:hypothetical protein
MRVFHHSRMSFALQAANGGYVAVLGCLFRLTVRINGASGEVPFSLYTSGF